MSSGRLKPGWTPVAFGDVVRLSTERSSSPDAAGFDRYVGLEHLDPGDLRIRRWGRVVDGITFTTVFRPGQVLFGKRRAYLRKVALADFSGVCSGDIYVLESKDEAILLPSMLPFVCRTDTFFQHAIGTSAGSLSPRTNWRNLATYEFVLPPLDEQRRIATAGLCLWRYQDALLAARDATESVRRALIFSQYQGGASEEAQVDTPIGPLPVSWTVQPLGDRYEVQLGKMMSAAARRGANQTPYIRNVNVRWNALNLRDVATMSMSESERDKYSLRNGDILACEGRHVGKSALWRGEIPGACYQKALHRIRRLSKRDDPEYLLHCLQFYSWAGRFVSETGETTIPHLPAERLRAMLFPFPPPEQQARIVARIRVVDQALQRVTERIAGTRELLQGLKIDGQRKGDFNVE
jgi:type I restriction enzyme S subunit